MPHHSSDADPAARIAGYEALLALSERMLTMAREADWPGLLEQRDDYVAQVERLARQEASPPGESALQRRQAELLERLVENDREIREHLARRRDELGELIEVSRRQRDLQRAYGDGSARRGAEPGHRSGAS